MVSKCQYLFLYDFVESPLNQVHKEEYINCFAEKLTDDRRLALFPAETTVKGSHPCKPPTHLK